MTSREISNEAGSPSALDLARSIVEILDEHKGEDILLMDLQDICSFTDYFVLCTGGSERTLGALAEEVVRQLKRDAKLQPRAREGRATDGWILLDYGDVIAHLLSEDLRDYYRIEDVWREGRVLLRVK